VTKIRLNGKESCVEDGMSIADLLRKNNVRFEVVTVEVNDVIISRKEYETTHIQNDDRIEFLYFMGGGDFAAAPHHYLPPLGKGLRRG
jgi:thiamine biosynthesis protein ThiS